MIRSELLTPYLVEASKEALRDDRLKKAMKEVFSTNLKGSPVTKKQLLCLIGYSLVGFIGFSLLCGTLGFLSDHFKGIDSSLLDSVVWVLRIAITGFVILFIPLAVMKHIIAKLESEGYQSNIKELFLSIADKNYEIRTELIENNSKLKIVVEENEYVAGTSSVIKVKPKSLTAYMIVSSPKEEIIKTIVSLVKETENRFK